MTPCDIGLNWKEWLPLTVPALLLQQLRRGHGLLTQSVPCEIRHNGIADSLLGLSISRLILVLMPKIHKNNGTPLLDGSRYIFSILTLHQQQISL